MSYNTFGTLFTITTWGESHGPAIGVVIDGCPAGLPLDVEEINTALARRAPGQNAYTTPREEKDIARILSGVFKGQTTGAPISLLIENGDADSTKYEAIQDLLRPGHANFTYLEKYGIFDYRGGGRASARETAGRVAAGAVAAKLLATKGITVTGWLEMTGGVEAQVPADLQELRKALVSSELFTPDAEAEQRMKRAILEVKKQDDSLGGIVGFRADGLPVGLGDPVYKKIDALLACAMLSIPAVKGFELGTGFAAANQKGSESNDLFTTVDGKIVTGTNNAGGSLGGITTGMPLTGRVAFKPTSSIAQPMPTVDSQGSPAEFVLPVGSRHDPCVAIRGVPVVEAMCSLVLADALLLRQAGRTVIDQVGNPL